MIPPRTSTDDHFETDTHAQADKENVEAPEAAVKKSRFGIFNARKPKAEKQTTAMRDKQTLSRDEIKELLQRLVRDEAKLSSILAGNVKGLVKLLL